MQTNKPFTPRVVLWMVSCMIAATTAPATAQEYAPVVDDRVRTGVEYPVVEQATAEAVRGLDLGVVVGAGYDDNIFLSSRDPESGMVYRVAPLIAYRRGDLNAGEGVVLRAGYVPSAMIYGTSEVDDRIDHEAMALLGYRGKVGKIWYEGGASKLGDATADTGRPTDRFEIQNEARVAWTPREKIALEAAVGNRLIRYEDPVFFDSERVYVEAALRYAYSPKTELGLIVQAGRFDVDGAGPQDTRRMALAMAWQPREKIRVSLEGGAEYRKFDNGSGWNPVFEARVAWQPRKESEVFLNGYIREEASAFFVGQNYTVAGVSAGISQRLGGRWSGRLEGGYETNNYEQVSGPGSGGREDRIWFIRPALVRKVGEQSELIFSYRISDNESSDATFGYDQQVLGVELKHKF